MLKLAKADLSIDNEQMQKEYGNYPAHELGTYLHGIEDKAVALSVYDYPTVTGMSDLIVFALTIYDTPNRAVDPQLLQEVFEKAGKFGLVAIDGAVMKEPPYVHLGKFNDSLDNLQRTGLVIIENTLFLTDAGKQVGNVMLSRLMDNEPTA